MSALLDHFDRTALAAGLKIPGGSARRMGNSPEAAALLGASAQVHALQEHLMLGGTIPGTTDRLDAKPDTDPAKLRRFAYHTASAWYWSGAMRERGFPVSGSARQDGFIPQASQALTDIIKGVYQYRFNDLPYWEGMYLPVDSTSFDPAANEIAWYEQMLLGCPRANSTYDITTIPLVPGPAAAQNRIGVIPALVGMNVNFMDDRRERMAVRNQKPDFQIELNKVRACKRSIAEMFNALWAYGDVNMGIDGLHNHPQVAVIDLGLPWSAKTPLQINDDLAILLNTIMNNSGGDLSVMKSIVIHLPPLQYQKATNTPLTAAGTDMVLQKFKENNGLSDNQVVWNFDLQAVNSQAFAGGPQSFLRDRAVVTYLGDGKDEDLSGDPKFVLPQPIETPFPERNDGLSWTTYFHARGGSLMLPDARRLLIAEGL